MERPSAEHVAARSPSPDAGGAFRPDRCGSTPDTDLATALAGLVSLASSTADRRSRLQACVGIVRRCLGSWWASGMLLGGGGEEALAASAGTAAGGREAPPTGAELQELLEVALRDGPSPRVLDRGSGAQASAAPGDLLVAPLLDGERLLGAVFAAGAERGLTVAEVVGRAASLAGPIAEVLRAPRRRADGCGPFLEAAPAAAVAPVGHELKNLLTVVLGHADLLAAMLREGPAARRVADLRRAAYLAGRLSRHVAGPVSSPDRRAHLGVVASNVERLLDELVGSSVRLAVEPVPGGAWVAADAASLELLLIDLLIAARDVLTEGDGLTLRPGRWDDAIGRPNPAAEPRRAWVPLSLLLTATPGSVSVAPSQAALAGARAVVGALGGSLAVRRRDAGWSIDVHLPAAESARARSARERAGIVLVVDDEPTLRELTRDVLQRAGLDVVTARCGTEALCLMRTRRAPVDLLVADVGMPGMDGPALAAAVRAEHPEVRVLYVTGGLPLPGLAPGERTAVLGKPFSLEELEEAVERLLADEDEGEGEGEGEGDGEGDGGAGPVGELTSPPESERCP